MAHENARVGFKNLFTAEVLIIVASVIDIVGLLLALIPALGLVLYGVVVIISVILAVIAFILQLVGLSKAGKDEPMIKSAFTAVIIGLIVTLILPAVGSLTQITWFNTAADFVNSLISLFVTHHVLFGGANLNSSLSDKASSTWKLYLVTILISLIIVLIAIIVSAVGLATIGSIIAVVLGIVYTVLEIIAYIKYVSFLNTAKNEV